MEARERERPADQRICVRIGINLGDIIHDEGDIYGDGANVAARLETLAEPGGILISGRVHDHLEGKTGIGFEPLGLQRLNNIPEPIAVTVLPGSPMVHDAAGSVSCGASWPWPPNNASLLRLATAVLVEIDETWQASTQPYFNWNTPDA